MPDKSSMAVRNAPDRSCHNFRGCPVALIGCLGRQGGGEAPPRHSGRGSFRRIKMPASSLVTAVDRQLDAVLARLLRANEQEVPEIVSQLSPRERAELAKFCYSRAHLHEIGLAIAATCDLHALMQVSSSTAAGNVLFAQSRERTKPMQRTTSGPRSRITLAKSVSGNSSLAGIIANIAETSDRFVA